MAEMNICPYCHEDVDGYVRFLPRSGAGKACIHQRHPINGGWQLEVSQHSGTRVNIKINFCPVCGRRLEVQ